MAHLKFGLYLLLAWGPMCFGQTLLGGQVVVFAAASLSDALREIADHYSRNHTNQILFSFGGSSALARQIEQGAPADIFISADQAQMDLLESKGLIETATRTDLLGNSLVIVTASENGAPVHQPQDLAKPAIQRIALGDPKAVPIGVYARQFLEQEGLWHSLASKIVPTESVRAALAAVEAGNADASIVYKTDALISKRVKTVYVVPPGKGPLIRYPAAVLKNAGHEEAKGFLTYLQGRDAEEIFTRRGFSMARSAP